MKKISDNPFLRISNDLSNKDLVSDLKGHKSNYEICKQTVWSGIQNENKCHMSKHKTKSNMTDFDCFYSLSSLFWTRNFNSFDATWFAHRGCLKMVVGAM